MTDTIEVWRIHPLGRAHDVAALRAILPSDTLARIERAGDVVSQRAAITSRAVLRLLLARYTQIPANELRLVPGKNGKPNLDSAQNTSGITFNFSDSRDMALVAVARSRALGVDVEQVREVEYAMKIAQRYFAPEEAAELNNVSDAGRSRAFLEFWARHEAVVKARSGTIWKPGKQADLAMPESSLYVQRGPKFTVRDVDCGSDYVGALAAEGDGWSIDVKDYND